MNLKESFAENPQLELQPNNVGDFVKNQTRVVLQKLRKGIKLLKEVAYAAILF
jgi:hypothetical protein